MKSYLRLLIPTSSNDITRDTWGISKAQCLNLLKDSLGSPGLKFSVNNNRNINKYGLMICISPSSVVSSVFFLLLLGILYSSLFIVVYVLLSQW